MFPGYHPYQVLLALELPDAATEAMRAFDEPKKRQLVEMQGSLIAAPRAVAKEAAVPPASGRGNWPYDTRSAQERQKDRRRTKVTLPSYHPCSRIGGAPRCGLDDLTLTLALTLTLTLTRTRTRTQVRAKKLKEET